MEEQLESPGTCILQVSFITQKCTSAVFPLCKAQAFRTMWFVFFFCFFFFFLLDFFVVWHPRGVSVSNHELRRTTTIAWQAENKKAQTRRLQRQYKGVCLSYIRNLGWCAATATPATRSRAIDVVREPEREMFPRVADDAPAHSAVELAQRSGLDV